MQTFLPSTSFEQSAKWLDNKRLGKQRLECADALAMLLGQPSWMSDKQYAYISKKYKNHPCWQMWQGYEVALIDYSLIICDEWQSRGYKDTYLEKMASFTDMPEPANYSSGHPSWLTEEFASNHRSILLGKAQEALASSSYAYSDWDTSLEKYKRASLTWEWYQQFNWQEQPAQRVNGKWPYLWPEVA